MANNFFNSSPKSQQVGLTPKYEALQVGQSFVVDCSAYSSNSLRSLTSRKGKELKRKFSVILHKDYIDESKSKFEVARKA